MSDTYFRYVPSDPTFLPLSDAATRAKTELQSMLPQAESIAIHIHDEVCFVDAGQNWEGVFCPLCGADAEAWWAEAMSESAKDQFKSLNVQAPCCGEQVSLNELRYVWPSAFGRFVIEAMNPGHPGLSEHQLAQLGSVLAHQVREVKARV